MEDYSKLDKIILSSRMPLKLLAMTADYLKSIGMPPRSRSEIVGLGLYAFNLLLIQNRRVEEFSSNHEALRALRERHGIDLESGSERTQKQIVSALQKDELNYFEQDMHSISEEELTKMLEMRLAEGRKKEEEEKLARDLRRGLEGADGADGEGFYRRPYEERRKGSTEPDESKPTDPTDRSGILPKVPSSWPTRRDGGEEPRGEEPNE